MTNATKANDAGSSQVQMDLQSARMVLGNEASALSELAKSLGDEFSQALDILSNVKGRVVVTGMGKSGHIAAKITASMASTGTPAMFVHPAEASHGDLGMITQQDAIFALSNSGETSELVDLIEYAKRFNIPLIGMTGRSGSTLARQSTVALVYPNVEEACPMGLAPTTSTTMMVCNNAEKMAANHHDEVAFATKWRGKDVAYGAQMADALGCNTEIFQYVANVFQRAGDAGLGEANESVILKVLQGERKQP